MNFAVENMHFGVKWNGQSILHNIIFGSKRKELTNCVRYRYTNALS